MTAKEQLKALAKLLEEAAVDAHADGLVLSKTSAVWSLLAASLSEEQCAKYLRDMHPSVPRRYGDLVAPILNAKGGKS